MKKFDPASGSDEFTGTYYLADGQLEILPANENEPPDADEYSRRNE